MGRKRKTVNSRQKRPYTKGQVNYLIDDLLHPLYKDNQWFRLLDGLAHAIVEGNIPVSAKKFIQYNMQDIVKVALKSRQKRKKRKN